MSQMLRDEALAITIERTVSAMPGSAITAMVAYESEYNGVHGWLWAEI